MTGLTVGTLRETAVREKRVALDPEVAGALVKPGSAVLIEKGAGSGASLPDAAYAAAGASVVDRDAVIAGSDALAVIAPPDAALESALRRGQTVVGLVDPLNQAPLMERLNTAGVTVAAFELLPRTLSRAQSMDAVSSQAALLATAPESWRPRTSTGTCR